MTKRQSKKGILLVILLLIIGIVLAFCKFDIPFTNYTYNGFINSIKLGLDVEGGVSAVYTASLSDDSDTDFDTAVESTISRLETLLSARGYTEATVTRQSTDKIRVEVPDVDDPEEIFDLIGQPAELSFKTEEDPEADSVITASDIKSVYATIQDSEYGVVIKFTTAGALKFADLTGELADSSGSVYVYLGNELYTTLTVSEEITSGSTFISGNMDTREDAENFALKIESGTFSTDLTLYSSSIISPTLGINAISSSLIAGIIGLILIFLLMALVYRAFGMLANIALIFYILLVIFFLQAIPLVQLTLAGIAGIILGLGMAVDANIIIFERIKDEYRQGKRIPASIESGFKRAKTAIIDSNLTTIMVALVLYFFGTGSIQGFATTLLISIVISMFTALFVTKWLINLYLPFNSSNSEKFNLYREGNANASK